ncbi:hypothetical protein EWI61_14410, partial [Methylolobus aquaticus]
MRKSALITSALLSALATGPVAAQSAADATGMSPADETMVADPMATGTEAAPATSDTAAAAMTSTYTCPDGTSVATADSQCADDRWYLAPFATFMQPGGDRKAFGAWGGGMGIGKVINEWLNLEIRGFWMNYSNNRPGVGGQTDVTGGSADALFFFDRDVFSPYAVASLGANNTSYRTAFGTGNTQPMFQWQFGVGATYELADNFLLRSDVRYQGMFQNGNTIAQGGNYNASVLNDLVVNAGFVIPLGEKPVPVAGAAPAAVDDCSTRDSDGDGVNDCDDK